MSTVYFYFSFPTNYKSGTYTTTTSASFPCSSDVEYECIKSNYYSNWEIGNVYCMFAESCKGGSKCCQSDCPNTGCDKTCKSTSSTGIGCKGYNIGECGCTGLGGSHNITRKCQYNCYVPDTDNLCYPGATSVIYISGRKDLSSSDYYVFKAIYNTSTFTKPEQLIVLENNLNMNMSGLSDTYINSNIAQLNILKSILCTADNLKVAPCSTYCKVTRLSDQLPTSNCEDSWNKFCSYSSNVASAECDPWCHPISTNESNCKNSYLTYCSDPSNFYSSVCRDFYKTQYVNDQLTDNVLSILTTNCAKYGDSDGNVIDSSGNMVEPGNTSSDYPVDTCACFLPKNVYSTFYDKITESNPDLRNFFTINQCSYPDCANAAAIQPQKLTCPDVAITSCIVNNTIGGNATNSNFNIVNNCITQVEKTGTYTNNNLNTAPTEETKFVPAVIPPPQSQSDTPSDNTAPSSETTSSDNADQSLAFNVLIIIAILFILILILIGIIRK